MTPIPVARAAFFDIDGTLTSERTWKGILDYYKLHRQRRATHLAFIASHYPLYFLRRLDLISETAFRAPWAAHLAWYVRGNTPEQAQLAWDWAVSQFLNRYWRVDTRAILDEHRQCPWCSASLWKLVRSIPWAPGWRFAPGDILVVPSGLW
jgi:hypothetical protein